MLPVEKKNLMHECVIVSCTYKCLLLLVHGYFHSTNEHDSLLKER